MSSVLSFFFNDTATTAIYTLSLHDALPIYDVLCAFPEDEAPELGKLVEAFDDRQERIPLQRAVLAGETGPAVGEEDLGLADPAGIEEQLAGLRLRDRILEADPELEVAEGDPARLAAPPGVDELLAIGEQLEERGAGLRSERFFEPGGEDERARRDLHRTPAIQRATASFVAPLN